MKPTANETVAEVAKEFGDNIALMRKCKCVGVSLWICLKFKLRFEAAHKRDREAARRRAERSAIYNMLESFPHDWECNPEAVKKWLTMWQRNADDLCEGGLYAER